MIMSSQFMEASYHVSSLSFNIIMYSVYRFQELLRNNFDEKTKNKCLEFSFTIRHFCKCLDMEYYSKLVIELEEAVQELSCATFKLTEVDGLAIGNTGDIPFFDSIKIEYQNLITIKMNPLFADMVNFKVLLGEDLKMFDGMDKKLSELIKKINKINILFILLISAFFFILGWVTAERLIHGV